MDTTLIFYKSKKKQLLPLILCFIFVLMCSFLLYVDISDKNSWFGLVFFGGGFLFLLWDYTTNKPKLIITEAGITGRNMGNILIRWEDIYGVAGTEISTGHSTMRYMSLAVNESVLAQYKNSKLTKWMVNNMGYLILVDGLTISQKDLIALVQSIIDNNLRVKETISIYKQLNPQY
jgi:hypothetical protein